MKLQNFFIALLFFFSTLNTKAQLNEDEKYIALFLKNNPKRSSIYFTYNDSVLVNLSADQQFPVASLSKTYIALYFAQEASKGNINPEEQVPLSALEKYNMLDTNFKNWKNALPKNTESVALKIVARGMIEFSANANTDYLIDLLGLDNINRFIQELEVAPHQPIYPFTASAVFSHNPDQLPKNQFLQQIDSLSYKDYTTGVIDLHKKLQRDTAFREKILNNSTKKIMDDVDYDLVWSRNFSKSTTEAYGNLISSINSDNFQGETQKWIAFLFEDWLMEQNPDIASFYKRMAYKGAGTLSMINVWLYNTDKNGNRSAIVCFFNELNQEEFKQIERLFSDFVFNMSTDNAYRQIMLSRYFN